MKSKTMLVIKYVNCYLNTFLIINYLYTRCRRAIIKKKKQAALQYMYCLHAYTHHCLFEQQFLFKA